MENQPWQQYYRAFAEQAARIPADAFERSALLYEAAHNAYQSTTNELTTAGWDAETALMLGRLFGSVVKQWVDSGDRSVEVLQRELRTHYQQWSETE